MATMRIHESASETWARRVARLVSAGTLTLTLLLFLGLAPSAQAEDTPEAAPEASQAEAAEADSEEGEMAEEAERATGWDVSGRFSARFDGRWSDRNRTYDMDQTLQLNVDPLAYPNIHFRSSVWVTESLYESNNNDPAVSTLKDTYGSDVLIRPLYLHLDIEDMWGDSVLRIGRQRILEGPVYNRLDGIYFAKRTPKVDWYVFGGWRASLYEESHNDPAFGGGVSVRPRPGTRIAVDAYYVDEHRNNIPRYYRPRFYNLFYPDYPRNRTDKLDDTLVAVSLWQDITQNLRLFGRYTWYDKSSDELAIELSGYVPSWDVIYEVGYRGLLGTAKDRLSDTTVYYRVLGPQARYDHVYVGLHKPITEKLMMSLEAEGHDAGDDGPSRFNRDYVRVALSADVEEIAWDMDATATVEYWNPSGEAESFNLTGEVRREFGPVDVAVGADYERWVDEYQRYNPWPNRLNNAWIFFGGLNALNNNNFIMRLFDVENERFRENVYSLYAQCNWAIRENQSLYAEASIEEDDGPDSPYFRLRAGYEIRF